MRKIYTKVTKIARERLYQFMKNNQISPLNYHFHHYFDDYVKRHNILVMEHHFSSLKIEGLTMKDDLGVSISYEKYNPPVKQNFTKCHELGHCVLGHSGNQLAEIFNINSIDEREANIFSAYILMPDIVLLSKIYYRLDSFDQVMTDLTVSSDALKFRLHDLFRYRLNRYNDDISKAVNRYQAGQNEEIFSLFDEIHTEIEDEYRAVEGNPLTCMMKRLEVCGFITSTDFPELLDNGFRQDLAKVENISAWLEFDFKQSLGYAWRTDELTEKQAKLRARRLLLLEKR